MEETIKKTPMSKTLETYAEVIPFLHEMFKKRGFIETLAILYLSEEHKLSQSAFFDHLEAIGSYYNAYLRVKPYLIQHGLLQFTCDMNGQKFLELTEKGRQAMKTIKQVYIIISDKWNIHDSIENDNNSSEIDEILDNDEEEILESEKEE